jgi:cytoskeletal protein CcmA (bactofilin family)
MLKSEGLFGKREDRSRLPFQPVPPVTPPAAALAPAAIPPSANYGVNANAAQGPGGPKSDNLTPEGGSKLIVGPNIKLKGVEITDCDTLVVEGVVEATMDSRAIHISEHGTFRGKVGIDIAEIHGAFEGELTARDRLVVHATGRVSGTIRYGRLVIEEGGHIDGNIEASEALAPVRVAKPPPQILQPTPPA